MDFNKTQQLQIISNQAVFSEIKAGPMGFEPMTFSLEG